MNAWGGELTRQLMLPGFKVVKVNGVQANVCKNVRGHCDSKDLYRRMFPGSVFRCARLSLIEPTKVLLRAEVSSHSHRVPNLHLTRRALPSLSLFILGQTGRRALAISSPSRG